jgi:spore coat polysaccharide biosynthesis protein SpsF (cytidylyltransferase family)
MNKLIASITEVVNDIKTSSVLENVIDELSKSEEISKIVQLSKKP